MTEKLSDRLIEFLKGCQGRDVSLSYLRTELMVEPGSTAWNSLREYMRRLTEKKVVKPSGKNDGVYRVIKQVQPVRVFIPGRERRPIFDLYWPEDRERGVEIDIGEHIVLRENDVIVLSGVKSKGKTLICLNIAAMNIDRRPVLMGNEYTVEVKGSFEPSARFFNRLDIMSEWVQWTDEDGYDKFTLLPVKSDYAEHIIADRINIIDWINLDGNQLYDISKVIADIKSGLGRGICVVAVQKGEGSALGRGGQFIRDFADVEILLDGYGDGDDAILLTVKGCKEKTAPIVGKSYAYTICNEGTEIRNFREVKKCPTCRGSGYVKGGTCDECDGRKFVDR